MAKKKVKKDFSKYLKKVVQDCSGKKDPFCRDVVELWNTCIGLSSEHGHGPDYFISTTYGRCFLRDFINQKRKKGKEISENDILRFAFIAELLQIETTKGQTNTPLKHGITVEQANALLKHGITLRDIKHKTPQELAARRWNIVSVDEEKRELEDPRSIIANLKEVDATKGLSSLDGIRSNLEFDGTPTRDLKSRIELNRKRRWESEFKEWKEDAKRQAREGYNLNQVEYYDLLVLSDFHLAAGNHPTPDGIARFSPTEDFFYDDAFFRFLYYTQIERYDRGGYPFELVFNGDMADFAQIVVPEEKAENRNPLIPWPLPPMRTSYIDKEVAAFREKRDEEILPARLYRVVLDVYGKKDFKEAADHQIKLLEKLKDLHTAEELRFIKDEIIEGKTVTSPVSTKQYIKPVGTRLYKKQALELQQKTDAFIEKEQYQERDYTRTRVLAMQRDKALIQLADMYHGHPMFFRALAWFVAGGNRLVFMRGNHDPQWYWPEVQMAFVGWLHKAYLDLKEICENGRFEFPVSSKGLKRNMPDRTLDYFERNVDFNYSWFYYRERLAYIEHGGQQEAVDCHRYFLLPVYAAEDKQIGKYKVEPFPRPTTWLPDLKVSAHENEIEPPIGSLGLVYLVNNLEAQMPNFDRPAYRKSLIDYIRYENLKIIGKLLKALWRTIATWIRWVFLPIAGFFKHFFKQIGKVKKPFKSWHADIHDRKIAAYARLTGMPLPCVKELDRTRWVNAWRSHVSVWVFTLVYALLSLILVAALVVGIYAILSELALKMNFIEELKVTLPLLKKYLEPSEEPPKLVDYLWRLIKPFGFAFILYHVLKWLRNWIGLGEDFLRKPAQRVAAKLSKYGQDVPYIAFGHDHVCNAQLLQPQEGGNKDARSWYLNSGSWLFKYERDTKRLYREDHEYSFVRMIDTHKILAASADPEVYLLPNREKRPVVELLRWNDGSFKVESCQIFQGLD